MITTRDCILELIRVEAARRLRSQERGKMLAARATRQKGTPVTIRPQSSVRWPSMATCSRHCTFSMILIDVDIYADCQTAKP